VAKKVAFVDVDGVLFNIEAFKERYFKFLVSLLLGECRENQILEAYEDSKRNWIYDVDRHIALISAASSTPAFELRKKIEDFMRREAQRFIYPDAEFFLERLAETDYEILIATAGVEWFQEEKIPVDFYRHISGVKVTQDTTKVSLIGRFSDPEEDDIVLFDDTTHIIDKVKEFFPKVYAVQMQRGDDWDGASPLADFYVSDLEEAITLPMFPLPKTK